MLSNIPAPAAAFGKRADSDSIHVQDVHTWTAEIRGTSCFSCTVVSFKPQLLFHLAFASFH